MTRFFFSLHSGDDDTHKFADQEIDLYISYNDPHDKSDSDLYAFDVEIQDTSGHNKWCNFTDNSWYL